MEAEAGRKRRADVPLTGAQEREAAAMLLPNALPFKLKQTEGRSVRNTKASVVAACLLHAARGVTLTALRYCPLAPLLQRLKTLIQLEEYGNLPADEPSCELPCACRPCACAVPGASCRGAQSDARAPRHAPPLVDVSIEAPPSTYPAKKYCDLTGQPARYTDPKTKLRYADAAAFEALQRLSPEQVQATLALRRAAVVLK